MFGFRDLFGLAWQPRKAGVDLVNFIEEHTGRMSLRDWSRWGMIKLRYEDAQRYRAIKGLCHQTFAEWLSAELFTKKEAGE